MEHRDQRQESHGVHVCNKCGWPFPNPHPSAKHRRAHKRICGTIEGFKLVEFEANTVLTVSDDDGDQKCSSPKVLGESCSNKAIAETKTKPKESEDEVFSDAASEFSHVVGPIKTMGDTFDSVGTPNMAAEDEMSSSLTLKDREVLEATINRSGLEQKSKINQEFVNLDADSGTPSSSSNEKQKVENLVVAETAIDRSENEQETKFGQELATLETDFETPWSSSSTENGKVEISAVPEATTDQYTKINQELVNLETSYKSGDCVVFHNDHMITTTTTRVDPETIVPPQQERKSIDRFEDVPQSSPSPDTRYIEKKNEGFGLPKNFAETAASSGKKDNVEEEPVRKMEGTIEIVTEPTAFDETLLSMVDDDMPIHLETPPSFVVDVEPVDLSRVTSDAAEELESCSCNNLLDTDKLKKGNDHVHLPSVSSDVNVVDYPEALVEDSKDHKDVKLTSCVIQDFQEGVNGLEGSFKDSILKESYSTLQAEPFDQAAEVPSFDTKTVVNRGKKERRVKNVSVDAIADWSGNSGQEVDEIPIQVVNVTQIGSILGENEKRDNQTLGDATNFGTDGIPSASFSPKVEPMAPSKNSLDNHFENVAKVLSNENSAAPTGNQKKLDDNEVGNGGVLLADDENNAEACERKSEDTVQVRRPADAHGRKDNGVGEKVKFGTLDIASVEDEPNPSKEKFLSGIDSTPENTTNSRENKCSDIAEEIANESPRKFTGTKSENSKSFDITLVSDTHQSVKEDDHGSAAHMTCISGINADDQSCHGRDFNTVQNSSDIHGNEEANLVSIDNESVTGRLDDSRDGGVSQLVGDAVRITSETWQGDVVITDLKPQFTLSLLDASVDVSSQTDSLEGNWGSVSVLSTQSDLPAVVNGEVTLPAQAEAGGTNSKNTEAATERQHSDRSDLFEPPSFMTWVEPNNGQGIQNLATSEIQTAQNGQQANPASLQAGWFPSHTHMANNSPGRKKNEAVIAKVTNWSTGKPHTALKNLLDDAALENKQKSSPTRKENLTSMIKKDEKTMNNGTVDRTVESITGAKSPASRLGKKEIPNEWNSPARYPSDIRRERRKGKPYWAQFVCCSSVH